MKKRFNPWASVLLALSIFFSFQLNIANAMSKKGKEPKMSQEEAKLSIDGMYKLVQYLNKLKTFPVEKSILEKETGLPLSEVFSKGGYYRGDFALDLLSRKEGEKDVIYKVEISADQTKVALPEMPPGEKFDDSSYGYLPFKRMAAGLGENHFRSLYYMDMEEYKKVNGTDSFVNPPEWKYRIHTERGPCVSKEERELSKKEILGLLNAIKENRFEAYQEEFKKKYPPKDNFSGHQFGTESLRIVYFNNKKDGKYFGKDLEEQGLTEYVGLHIDPVVGFEGSFPRAYLFDFFGIDQIDALQPPQPRPYAVLKTRDGVPHPPAIEKGMKASLPDVSAPGDKQGGWAHYTDVTHVADGWNMWIPGSYPHDGKKAERFLKKDIYRVRSVEILFSRKK